jgi:hypothetical protein
MILKRIASGFKQSVRGHQISLSFEGEQSENL